MNYLQLERDDLLLTRISIVKKAEVSSNEWLSRLSWQCWLFEIEYAAAMGKASAKRSNVT